MKDSISNTFYNPKKSLSTNKRKISLVKNKNSIEINKTNSNLFTSYVKNTKKKKSSIKLPLMHINSPNFNKTQKSFSHTIANINK
jgi:hypothetical protein